MGEENGDPDRLLSLNVGVDGEEEFDWGDGDGGGILRSGWGGGESRRSWMGKLEDAEREGMVGRGRGRRGERRTYRYESGTCEMALLSDLRLKVY